jgi:hypothetical protein
MTMMMHTRRTIDRILIVMAFLVMTMTPATAHSAAYYYYGTWNAGTGLLPITVPWQSGNITFNPTWIQQGPQQWNNLGQSMQFRYDGERNVNSTGSSCPTAPLDNWVFQRVLDGVAGTLAITWTCWRTTPLGARQLHSFTIEYDGSESWYSGNGDAPPTYVDVWSVASHEFGHATGWVPYHLDENGTNPELCLDDSTEHTMCSFYTPGTERMRTLEAHDVDTFSTAY